MQKILVNGEWKAAQNPTGSFHASNPALKETLEQRVFPVSGWNDLEALIKAGRDAARELTRTEPETIARFLEDYAAEIEKREDALVEAANIETGLPREPRLKGIELPRTTDQLRQAAKAAREQSWRRPTIDTKSNIRSVHSALGGPVVVLGPNNFPYAYNGIAGGDFAAAIAAGNPVIAKSHPAHPYTTTLLAEAAVAALESSGMPKGSVQLFYHTTPELGEKLVAHKDVGAVAFTGGRASGLALKAAADRAGKPIYLEMSSVNPVFVMPGALRERCDDIAKELNGSCSLGAGQFCTKPGIAVVQSGKEADRFISKLTELTEATKPGTLLTERGPHEVDKTVKQLKDAGAALLVGGKIAKAEGYAYTPTLLLVSAERFLQVPERLQCEAFGAVCLVVVAEDPDQMRAVAECLEGNLTGSIYSDTEGSDESEYKAVEEALRGRVGRLLNDKMPTGVAVNAAMNHGGPYPATGHPGFTAVGFPTSVIRFSALHSYDNVRQHRLPRILQDKNPSGKLLRQIDGEWTTADVS